MHGRSRAMRLVASSRPGVVLFKRYDMALLRLEA